MTLSGRGINNVTHLVGTDRDGRAAVTHVETGNLTVANPVSL